MKTQMNISNLKKAAVTVLASLLITTGSFTQPNQGNKGINDPATFNRLEALMSLSAQSIRYIAPATDESENTSDEMENLEVLVGNAEASLKYEASAYAEEVAPAMERLESLVAAVDASLKYEASDYAEAEEITPAMERLEMLVASADASLRYAAPVAENSNEIGNITENANEIILADKTK